MVTENPSPQNVTSKVAQPAIRTVADIQREFERREFSGVDRVGEAIGAFVGTFRFVGLQLLFVIVWLGVNSGRAPGIEPFDKPPFSLLQLLVSIEAIILLTFVAMRENRMRRAADRRAQLELQVSLLAERESTEILQVLLRIAERLGLDDVAESEDTRHLSKQTHLRTLAHDLEEELSETE